MIQRFVILARCAQLTLQPVPAGETPPSWQRRLLARPLGVATKSVARGERVPVAMSGALDIFDRLVRGCRFLLHALDAACRALAWLLPLCTCSARASSLPAGQRPGTTSPFLLTPITACPKPRPLLKTLASPGTRVSLDPAPYSMSRRGRYVVDPDGSLRCAEQPPAPSGRFVGGPAGIVADGWGLGGGLSYPLGLAVSSTTMVLAAAGVVAASGSDAASRANGGQETGRN